SQRQLFKKSLTKRVCYLTNSCVHFGFGSCRGRVPLNYGSGRFNAAEDSTEMAGKRDHLQRQSRHCQISDLAVRGSETIPHVRARAYALRIASMGNGVGCVTDCLQL